MEACALNNLLCYYRVFVFPGPQPFVLPTVLLLAPGSGPQFVFTDPGLQFVSTGPGFQFVYTNPNPHFVVTGPGPHYDPPSF